MRVAVYIDGFNLYRGVAKPIDCKWVNLESLFERALKSRGANEQLVKVHFFTAMIRGPRRKHQETYLDALRTLPKFVDTLGTFSVRHFDCEVSACESACERHFTKDIEKKTDVAIGCMMVRDALKDEFDRALLVTGDSDMIPAVQHVLDEGKDVQLLIPCLGVKSENDTIRRKVDQYKSILPAKSIYTLGPTQLIQSQFSNPYIDQNGNEHNMPEAWRIAPTSAFSDYKTANGL